MQRAFVAGIIIAIIAPLLGTFLVVRRYSLLADTLAHVSLTGVALGILAGINPILSALGLSVIASIGIETLREKRKIFGESILAIFLSGSLAVAIVLISAAKGLNVDFFSFLFGSITTVQQSDLIIIAVLGIAVLVTVLLLYRQLFLVSFDEDVAKASGLPAKALNMTLIILAAITVALSIRIIGALLIGAMIVIPVVTASQFAKSFRQSVVFSCILGVVAVISGLILSFYLNLASGASIVVLLLIFFMVSLFVEKH